MASEEVEACALQDYIAGRSEFAAKRVFSSHDEILLICALSCFDKSASKLDSFFMSNEERGEAQKKKLPSFCDIIQMRDMNSCKNFSNQVWELISKRQIKFCRGCYHRRCQQWIISSISQINEQRQYRNDCLKNLRKVSQSIIFLWNLIGHHFVLGLNHHFSETCVFLVFLLFWNQEMFDIFIFDKIFWLNSNMQNWRFIVLEH